MPTNCLSVFDYFVRLALKGLMRLLGAWIQLLIKVIPLLHDSTDSLQKPFHCYTGSVFYVQIKNSMENAGMIRDSAGNVNKAKTAGIMKNVKKKVRDMDSDARDEASGKIHFRTVRKFAAYIL